MAINAVDCTGLNPSQINTLKSNEKNITDLSKTVIRVEEIAKSAHKRIDSIENKGE